MDPCKKFSRFCELIVDWVNELIVVEFRLPTIRCADWADPIPSKWKDESGASIDDRFSPKTLQNVLVLSSESEGNHES